MTILVVVVLSEAVRIAVILTLGVFDRKMLLPEIFFGI